MTRWVVTAAEGVGEGQGDLVRGCERQGSRRGLVDDGGKFELREKAEEEEELLVRVVGLKEEERKKAGERKEGRKKKRKEGSAG